MIFPFDTGIRKQPRKLNDIFYFFSFIIIYLCIKKVKNFCYMLGKTNPIDSDPIRQRYNV